MGAWLMVHDAIGLKFAIAHESPVDATVAIRKVPLMISPGQVAGNISHRLNSLVSALATEPEGAILTAAGLEVEPQDATDETIEMPNSIMVATSRPRVWNPRQFIQGILLVTRDSSLQPTGPLGT
jgi:hypothetical protein